MARVDRRDKLLAYVIGGVVLLALLAGAIIVASGGLRRRERGSPDDSATGGQLFQVDSETGEKLWEVRLGRVTREYESKTAQVTDTECVLYTNGFAEMVVTAPSLLVDWETEVLTFDSGVTAKSDEAAQVPYTGESERLIYYVEERRVRMEDRAEFDYGRSKFMGSTVDLWFEPIEGTDQSRLAKCEVVPMVAPAGQRAALALFAIATASAAVPAAQTTAQEQRYENAVLRADRLIYFAQEGLIVLEGTPEVQMGDAVLSADHIECTLNPEKPDELLSARAEGGVTLDEVKVLTEETARFRRKERVTHVEGRSAVYSAESRTATLTGGVVGSVEETNKRTASFEATEFVAHFDEANTLTKVVASGSPVTAVNRDYWTEEETRFAASTVTYYHEDPPRITATGSPKVTTLDGTFQGGSLTCHFVNVEKPIEADPEADPGAPAPTGTETAPVADRAVFEGGFTADMAWQPSSDEGAEDKKPTYLEAKSASATLYLRVEADGSWKPGQRPSKRIEMRGDPKITVWDDEAKTKTSAEVTCDVIWGNNDEAVWGEGNVHLTSAESGGFATAERIEMESEGPAGSEHGRFVLRGGVRAEFTMKPKEDDPDGKERPVRLTGSTVTLCRPAEGEETFVLSDGTATIEPEKEGEEPTSIRASSMTMTKGMTHITASGSGSGRPSISQGETTVEADRLEVRIDAETREPVGGFGAGNVTFHARSEKQPEKEGDEPRIYVVDGTADRVDLLPDSPVPAAMARYHSGETASRYRLTGAPRVTMVDQTTGRETVFSNIAAIDIYPLSRPGPAGEPPVNTVIVDAHGAGGPAELRVYEDEEAP